MDGIPGDLERKAFHSPDGELAWNRDDARDVTSVLADQGFAILGGEVWFVRTGQRFWTALVPQRDSDRPAPYAWRAEREPSEEWAAFVRRSAGLAIDAVEGMPGPDDLPHELGGSILYHLSCASEAELGELEEKRARTVGTEATARGKQQASSRRPGFLSRLLGRG